MAKRKKSKYTFTGLVLIFNIIALLLISIYFQKEIVKYSMRFYRWYSSRQAKDNIGASDFPIQYSVHGIDISHYQTAIDWQNLQSISKTGDTIRYQFVFVKATEGTWLEDRLFEEHWENAKKYNKIRGAYHYLHVNRDIQKQANTFIKKVKLERGDLPPVIDIEENKKLPKAKIVKAVKEFSKILEGKYHVKPIIYSNRNFIEDYLADDFKNHPFWVAHYFEKDIKMDEVKWKFWQHSDNASLLVTGEKIDANIFRGNIKDLRKMTLGTQMQSFEQAKKSIGVK
jgi:lysozyme